jgi:hypothetical protein
MDEKNTKKGMPNMMSGAAMAFGINREAADTEEEAPTFK